MKRAKRIFQLKPVIERTQLAYCFYILSCDHKLSAKEPAWLNK